MPLFETADRIGRFGQGIASVDHRSDCGGHDKLLRRKGFAALIIGRGTILRQVAKGHAGLSPHLHHHIPDLLAAFGIAVGGDDLL